MTDALRTHDGLTLRYRTWSRGPGSALPPVVLLHGFAAHARLNWEGPGVVEALVSRGRRVYAPDARGHGDSDKPHDDAFYGEALMARDVRLLIDRVGADRVQVAGYSMGAVVALLAAAEDARISRLVVGGIGAGAVEVGGLDTRVMPPELVAAALTAEDVAHAPERTRGFRILADATGSDRLALAAQVRSVHRGALPLDRITVPTLVLAGESDPLAERPGVLAGAIAKAELALLPGDHLGVVRDAGFAGAIARFLSED
ncbi:MULTISPECIES: alpha/beta fold hydrolase [unclassified Streptomyces]|uniref:Alpha/beta fold hydrolase n=1 Tax=Streptomyces salyersiae TaxID=3075530 RepID=A0ABU2RS03_9ACTN|nr:MULTISPECIES: alpha/beta fold hydrolase [unclassified Streptomyces]AEN09389.1 alpha/beta hydrolase fold protein [Streptomyces sp. SirexAA-E]MDT0430124.1 alpha/beta fold hydrolase [Streptomyces sp. DSM 41770]MYR68805.1 alpha/beta fold hydrolase [Streptomyces sp. SID4939]MYS02274.1 alpha/beta fold hydrolase [Streptomyces sp. SID4940]MYT64750.1 alpha/beta fold hydrolase [Streptomyces sp. SID8357]